MFYGYVFNCIIIAAHNGLTLLKPPKLQRAPEDHPVDVSFLIGEPTTNHKREFLPSLHVIG